MADNDDSDEDCIDDDNSSDLEDGELEVIKKQKKSTSGTRKIFPDVDDEDDCEGIDDSDDDEGEGEGDESLEDDDDYAGEEDDDSENPKKDDYSQNSKDEDEMEIQDKLIEATLKKEAKAKQEKKD